MDGALYKLSITVLDDLTWQTLLNSAVLIYKTQVITVCHNEFNYSLSSTVHIILG